MPTQPTAPLLPAFPSFMSVFARGARSGQDGMKEEDQLAAPAAYKLPTDPQLASESIVQKALLTEYPIPPPYQHRKNSSSAHSDSTDSSPTTTVSTFDSPSITDPSPSSSPESPSSLLPPSLFRKTVGLQDKHEEADAVAQQGQLMPPQQPTRPESPNSRERNVKNLSLNMSPSAPRPATGTGIEGLHPFSAPTSPLRAPPKTGRRRPNNLTIQTPAFDKSSFSAHEVLPTPGYRPFLKKHESTPSLPSALSPVTAPPAGMHLPPTSTQRLWARAGSESSFSSLSTSSQGLQDVSEEAPETSEASKSQEAQERGYPDGPICIYDVGVHLYLEPSREEASKFSTVINVAKEVANPFATASAHQQGSVMSVWRGTEHLGPPEPQTAASDSSFKSALEWQRHGGPISPVTPKPILVEPEYIHVPWDHSSEILDDLYPLCQIIDERVSAGKSVLIHCQLGVSRSASLVIAYGLYKSLKDDFHSMYTAVKERSQWVGPNMSLIYQLMDFRAKLGQGTCAATAKPPPPSWFVNGGTDTEMTPRPYNPLWTVTATTPFQPAHQQQAAASIAKEPSSMLSTLPYFDRDDSRSATVVSNSLLPAALSNIVLSPGDSAAQPSPPTAFSQLNVLAIAPKSTKRNVPRPLPFRAEPHHLAAEIPPYSPQDGPQAAVSRFTVSHRPVQMDLLMRDLPATPSAFSPRTTEFRSLSSAAINAGDLAIEPSHSISLSSHSQPPASYRSKEPTSPQ